MKIKAGIQIIVNIGLFQWIKIGRGCWLSCETQTLQRQVHQIENNSVDLNLSSVWADCSGGPGFVFVSYNLFIIYFKPVSLLLIHYMDSSQSNPETKQLSRDYKCPCGKTYLSNAAIFTHIKQKHHGVAPGAIEKPKLESKPRGRPPLSQKSKNNNNEKNLERSKETQQKQDNPVYKQYYQEFSEIFNLLSEIHCREQFNSDIWKNVDTFKRMQEFIQSKQRPMNFRYMGVCIGIGISQFLKDMSQKLEKHPWRFQQVLILMILLIQYAIDENNRNSIIEQAPVELLIDYMNPFIKDHIQDYAEYLGIDNLWIIQEENMKKIFLCFYNWLKWKDYTQYVITLL